MKQSNLGLNNGIKRKVKYFIITKIYKFRIFEHCSQINILILCQLMSY